MAALLKQTKFCQSICWLIFKLWTQLYFSWKSCQRQMKSSKNKNIWKNLDVVLAVLLAFLGAKFRQIPTDHCLQLWKSILWFNKWKRVINFQKRWQIRKFSNHKSGRLRLNQKDQVVSSIDRLTLLGERFGTRLALSRFIPKMLTERCWVEP